MDVEENAVLTFKDLFRGEGLSDTLRRERAETRKARRKARDKRHQARCVPEPDELVSREAPGAGKSERQSEPSRDPARIGGETHQEMVVRLYQAFSGQMDQLEERLQDLLPESGAGIAEIDRTVKTLASLAKTLTVLMELSSAEGETSEESHLDDPETLRAELAERVERLCRERTA